MVTVAQDLKRRGPLDAAAVAEFNNAYGGNIPGGYTDLEILGFANTKLSDLDAARKKVRSWEKSHVR